MTWMTWAEEDKIVESEGGPGGTIDRDPGKEDARCAREGKKGAEMTR